MKDNPRDHRGTKTWPPETMKFEVWSYKIGKTLREFHVCFSDKKQTVAQGHFRIRVVMTPRPRRGRRG